MKGTFFCCFILSLQILSLVSATTRTFAPNHDFLLHKQGDMISHSSQKGGVEVEEKNGKKEVKEEEEYYGGMRKIGSSPPSCDHKCYGCKPCEAIQVPTTKTQPNHLGIQYTNYEPEGWKCKCGPSFYSP